MIIVTNHDLERFVWQTNTHAIYKLGYIILFAYDAVKKQKQILYKILPSVNSNIFEDIFKLGTVSQASPHSEIILIGGDGVQSSRLCYIYYLPISYKTQNYKLSMNDALQALMVLNVSVLQLCKITFNEYWISANSNWYKKICVTEFGNWGVTLPLSMRGQSPKSSL